ncbi:hypothetical protein V2J09_020047, partial [Rumex salicifolius]
FRQFGVFLAEFVLRFFIFSLKVSTIKIRLLGALPLSSISNQGLVRDFQYMKMGSIGRNISQHTSSRGNQMLNKCSRRGEGDDFVLIDVDSDIPNVIIVDVEESVQKKLRKPSPRTVINIDDDEDGDGAGSNDNDSTSASSTRSCVNPMQSKENGSRKGYGFGTECESGSTESDCSDCECMEGPAEELRYQWEQASKRRKTTVNTRVSTNNQASTSASRHDCHFVPGKENATTQPCSSKQHNPTNMRDFKGKNHEEKASAEGDFGNFLNNDGKHDPFDEYLWTFSSAHSPNISEVMRTGSLSRGNKPNESAGKPHYVDVDVDVDVDLPSSSFCENEHGPQEPFAGFARSHPAQQPSSSDAMRRGSSSAGINSTRYVEKPHCVDVHPHSSVFREDEHGAQENVLFTNELNAKLNHPSGEPTVKDPAIPAGPESKLPDDSDYEVYDRVASMDVDEELPSTRFCNSHGYSTTNSNAEPNSAAGLYKNFKSTNKVDLAEENTRHCPEPGIDSLQNHQKSKTNFRACPSVQMEADVSNSGLVNGLTSNKAKDVSKDEGGKQCPNDILTDRQKIKETDVYKRAMEEESASRQQQLQIQAEEAQRLRKRKKAESMRIVDMEKRQKQRLEEMREAQKREETNSRMKEQIRAEYRKKLDLIEASCKDMASLLRRLGVHVGGTSLTEVQSAFKKAVMKFHPDRTLRTDMRQQVEAEEKFKLINLMKDKYLPSQ